MGKINLRKSSKQDLVNWLLKAVEKGVISDEELKKHTKAREEEKNKKEEEKEKKRASQKRPSKRARVDSTIEEAEYNQKETLPHPEYIQKQKETLAIKANHLLQQILDDNPKMTKQDAFKIVQEYIQRKVQNPQYPQFEELAEISLTRFLVEMHPKFQLK
eukprot:TRINITY_DN16940_c0_g1_i3.p1 TRINITY_DN16940_c0_g1~~TRINITY_DN16940_c0_g1_i3.p1  ORF type:complete len:160 (+),score=60.31 TRINITY_DN16940_c0_g1_i3:134-613(+)